MYSLIGVDGNAFAIMGYTARALKRTWHRDLVDKMHETKHGMGFAVCADCYEKEFRAEQAVRKGDES